MLKYLFAAVASEMCERSCSIVLIVDYFAKLTYFSCLGPRPTIFAQQCMAEQRLSDLALLSIHMYRAKMNLDAVVDKCFQKYPNFRISVIKCRRYVERSNLT